MSGFGVDRSSVASGTGTSASSIPEAIIDAKGDLIAGSAADTPVRVAVGTDEKRLVADSTQAGGLGYVADTTNYAVAAKGDLLVGTAADTVAPLTVGAAGELPFPVSGATTGLAWLRAPHPGAYIINGKVSRSVAGNALTLAVKTLADADPSSTSPVYVLMPTVTSNLLDGGYVVRSITAALSMTVSSGSTLGHASGTLSPVYVYLLDNAGTIELAVSSTFYGGASVQTTVAEGGAGAADDVVLYSTTLRSNVAVVCLQRWESTQTTAGTWASTTGEAQAYPGGNKIPAVDGTPVGSLMMYAGVAAPAGWVLCFGQAVSRTTFAALFAVLGTTYGVGDGSTTFNLPDLRGRAVFGKDNMGGSAANRVTATSGITGTTLGAAGGDERLHQHSHGVTESPHSHGGLSDMSGSGGSVQGPGAVPYGSVSTAGASTGLSIQNAGAGSSQNMPPALILNYIIKT